MLVQQDFDTHMRYNFHLEILMTSKLDDNKISEIDCESQTSASDIKKHQLSYKTHLASDMLFVLLLLLLLVSGQRGLCDCLDADQSWFSASI